MYQSALKIPLYSRYASIPDGNAISVKYKNKRIAAEYDSEPREIILLGDALPDAGETITVEITDDSKRKTKRDITIPGF
jgi:hypothetical protein